MLSTAFCFSSAQTTVAGAHRAGTALLLTLVLAFLLYAQLRLLPVMPATYLLVADALVVLAAFAAYKSADIWNARGIVFSLIMIVVIPISIFVALKLIPVHFWAKRSQMP
jgi:hypothetical protein